MRRSLLARLVALAAVAAFLGWKLGRAHRGRDPFEPDAREFFATVTRPFDHAIPLSER